MPDSSDEQNGRQSTPFSPAGCALGCVLALLLWFFPLPVALIVWLFDLKGLFADYMYLALPVLALLPVVFGYLVGRVRRPQSPTR
jgi:hypothetical protein